MMTRVLIIRAAERKIEPFVVDEVHEAYATAGLPTGKLEHSIVRRPNGDAPGIGIFVDKSALTVHQEKQSYFVLADKLYGGNAVLYGFDETGQTVDAPSMVVRWYSDQYEVEQALRRGEVQRPVIKNESNDVVWRWPERFRGDA